MVELNPDFVETESVADVVQVFRPADAETPERSNVVQAFPAAPETSAGNQADAVRLVGDALRNATAARWPMYIRNVKQIIRAADANFDERKYGFGGLMDLLRACQRDALIRMERDRRGGLRVFPGAALQRAAVANEPQVDVAQDEQIIDTAPGEPTYETPLIPVEAEPIIDGDAQPVDTTAELLGRAKSRRPRVRPVSPSGGKKKRAAAAKRPSRSKKSASADDDNLGNQ
jgi:hypothetical protein